MGKQIKIKGKYPYDCEEYSSDIIKKGHNIFIEFESRDIDDVSKRKDLLRKIKEKFKDKHIWALYGKKENKKNWICLQVASRHDNDVVDEIISDIKCMVEYQEDYIIKKNWRSKFHKEVFDADYTYLLNDIYHQKYLLMKSEFNDLLIVAIDIKSNDFKDIDISDIKYTEVCYAKRTKALLWNAFGKEHKVLEKLKS